MVVAIDGLSTNGKTTLANKIARKLNFKNFNTGAVYRCIALEIINNNIDINNIEKVMECLNNLVIDFGDDKVYLNKRDVTLEIYTDTIALYSTKCASIKEIKDFVKGFQKKFIGENDTVIEGRDIGVRIAPNADIKFYLYADINTRVKRLCKRDREIDFIKAKQKLEEIDNMDITDGLFVKPSDAIEIDTSNYTLDEVYNIMMKEIYKIIKISED